VRVEGRRKLRDLIDRAVKELEVSRDARLMDDNFHQAYTLMSSASIRAAFDLSQEPDAVRDRYGRNRFGQSCLLARRMIERGVRFVQLFHEAWDHHSEVAKGVKAQLKNTDQATTALILDLKQRGLLDDTIVIWGGEFDRTPMVEADPDANRSKGRDHHNKSFTMFVAGGGFKRGITLGKTDELGFNVVEDPVQVHDLHATILQLLGFDHTKLTYRYSGRDFRLTDVHGVVVDKLLA